MDWFLRLFDLFLQAAKGLAHYLPQSGEDLLTIFGHFTHFAGILNNWLVATIGINLQRILAPLGGYVVWGFNWFIELVKNLVARV